MPRENVCVFIEPTSHGLIYGSCLFRQIASAARDAGLVTVIETDGTVRENDAAIETYDPAVFYGVGHGQCCIFTVEGGEKYIEAAGYTCRVHFLCRYYRYSCYTDRRLDMFAGRHVHLQSCVTGLNLGPELIRHGARSYIGYDNLFVYGVKKSGVSRPEPCEEPRPDADYRSFGDSDAEGERAIVLRGSTVGEAVDAIRAKFQEYIRRYREGDWKDRPIAVWAATFLEHDLDHLVALGDMDWRPCPAAAAPVIPPVWSAVAMALGFAPIGTVMTVIGGEEARKAGLMP